MTKSKILDNIKEFSMSSGIQDKLKWFSEKNESGYEKWLQHEFAYWLQAQEKHIVDIEYGVPVDKRKTIKDRFFVDLRLNFKKQKNDFYHAIELKVTKKDTGALKQSVQDLLRLNNARMKPWSFRSVTSIAFVNNTQDSGKYNKFWMLLNESNKKSNWIFTKESIGDTGVSMYIFIWSVPPRNVEKQNYIEFTNYLIETAKQSKITDFDKFNEKRRPKNAIEKIISKNNKSNARLGAK